MRLLIALGLAACAARGEPAPRPAAEAPSPERVLEEMRARDAIGGAETTLISELTQVASLHDPTQGTYTRTCLVLSRPDGLAAETVSDYPSPPGYRRPDFPGYVGDVDFDEDGNLIDWRTMRTASFATSEFSRRYEVVRKHRVHPAGAVIETEDFHRLRVFPPGSWDGLQDAEAALWASGRGFSHKLGKPASATPQPDGSIELRAEGADDFTGFWVITVDPAQDWLVRRAMFVAPDDLRPVVFVTTEGVVEGEGARAAKRGVVRYRLKEGHDLVVEAETLRVRSGCEAGAIERLKNAATPSLPAGASEVIDYRTDPPTRMRPGQRPER